MSAKQRLINEVIDIEGGYVNDPSDSGGETNFGITVYVARRYGYKSGMRYMTRDMAFRIYDRRYWQKLKLTAVEKISPIVAQEMFDTGVNLGTGRSAEFLQRSLNVLNLKQKTFNDLKVDGQIGAKSLNALTLYMQKRGRRGEAVLYKMIDSLQGAFYITLAERREKDERFMFGWFANRIR